MFCNSNVNNEIITVKSLKSKKKKLLLTFFVMLVEKYGGAVQESLFE